MLNMIFLNIAVCTIFYMAQSYFFWKAFEIGRSIGLDPEHVFFKFISEQQRSMNLLFLGTAIIVSACIGIFGLFYSHKIAGPLYHLNKYLRGKTVGESNYNLKFRDGDYFQELAEAVNVYIKHQEPSAPAAKRPKKSA